MVVQCGGGWLGLGSRGLASFGPFLGAPAGPRGRLNTLEARGQGLGIP